jgi:hypothetical protein
MHKLGPMASSDGAEPHPEDRDRGSLIGCNKAITSPQERPWGNPDWSRVGTEVQRTLGEGIRGQRLGKGAKRTRVKAPRKTQDPYPTLKSTRNHPWMLRATSKSHKSS